MNAAKVSPSDGPKCIIGYDPGGNGNHGVACLTVNADFSSVSIACSSVETVEDAIGWASSHSQIIGVGIDTLTRWATGRSGWRPADLWLRKHYPAVQRSVASPNSLFGSMPVGGMCFMSWARAVPGIVISETHPKVAYYALNREVFDWTHRGERMVDWLGEQMGVRLAVDSEHEFDAALSAYAVRQGMAGRWTVDLHEIPAQEGESIVEPFGPSKFFWPQESGT